MADEVVPFFEAVKVEAFTWRVEVPVPADGRYVHAFFDARFRYLDEGELKALLAQRLPDRELAERVLIGVVMLQGEGEPQLRTEAAIIKQVLDVDRAPAATFGTYMAAIQGLAPAKN